MLESNKRNSHREKAEKHRSADKMDFAVNGSRPSHRSVRKAPINNMPNPKRASSKITEPETAPSFDVKKQSGRKNLDQQSDYQETDGLYPPIEVNARELMVSLIMS